MPIIEQWRPVAQNPNYEVSDAGRVRRVTAACGTQAGRILKPANFTDGYQGVTLHAKGKRRSALVHRLVALAFLPATDEPREVNHIDGDKQHNAIGNLEWASRIDNQRHAARTGLAASGARQHLAKLTPAQVAAIRSSSLSGPMLGREYGVHKATIARVRSGATWRGA